MSVKSFNKVDYGFSQPLNTVFPDPIVSQRAPTTGDKTNIGRVWIDQPNDDAYILTSIVSNLANWEGIGGGAVDFTSLVVTPGPISLTGTTTINTAGAANTIIGTGGTGALLLGNATGGTAVTGPLSASTTLTGGTGLIATTGNITASTGNLVSTLGSVSAATTVTAGTGVTATTGNITATLGDVVVTNGNVALATPATFLSLPGPVFVRTGAGAPANPLALHIGDTYIRTDATGPTERMYIATAVGAWTNVTCAA